MTNDRDPDALARKCTQWSDEYLFEQHELGPAAWTTVELWKVVDDELTRRIRSWPNDHLLNLSTMGPEVPYGLEIGELLEAEVARRNLTSR